MENNPLQKDDGTPVPLISFEALRAVIERLQSEYHLSHPLLLEGPAYGLAMVVRFALGLSADGGLICAVVRDGLPGAIAATCLRHLVNGGSQAVILVLGQEEDEQIFLKEPLKIAQAYGINIEYWKESSQTQLVADVIGQCHNVLFGGGTIQESVDGLLIDEAVTLLNEMSTPVHCVFAPYGFDLKSGKKNGEALYASSTLSLGAPVDTLLQYPDLLGRHYLADLSFPLQIYQELLEGCPPLFSEQPVIELLSTVES